ncbi:OsmC family protein [Undibacterium sp.]|jgi:putative redox protein|uniref:OsmC family protein n=1 Tax=Undibacterium sp. TaxID=1914977 RepID=UPI002CA79B23|nr:OsmC family protein [Undibacterium sp.]HTD06394.1 OsmC family protein [Undibacterium sp.]
MEIKVTKGQGKLQHVIEIGEHRLLTDVSAALGGDDSGPEPHDLLAAALGACTALTVTMYARRKQMDLQDIDVRIQHGQQEDVYVFTRSIKFLGNLTEDEQVRLTEIAKKCPVHKTLMGQMRIDTELVRA